MTTESGATEAPRSLDSTFESIVIDIPTTATFSSASSSSYDTDSSVNSATCCTRHSEHIYMEKPTGNSHTTNTLAIGVSTGSTHKANDIEAVYFKADHTKSWPIFILLISLIEIAVFIYDVVTVQKESIASVSHSSSSSARGLVKPQDLPMAIPTDSVFIYRPDRRLEVWRFISYMFLHANWFHLGFNVVIQLFYGIPLEVMHGSARIAIIYFAGVFAGSLGTSVVDSEVYLVGASGGVYALLAAHLANITLNYGQMKYAVAQLVSVVIFVLCDLGYAFYTQYLAADELNEAPPVSYIAHLTGALAGLTIGLLVLKSFERRPYDNLIWWLALSIYCAFTVFAIVFNLINTVTAQLMEEQGEVITQHLLHDLGVS
ncbi:protein rhomboid-like [Glossina fuscipes]|uniref:rhomboid protease n=2 Tax=Nemorhina TaxID=44051 RepID=A0A8U0W775_9MUSC|nr:protein rhomboid-like [Glossina fuscipes]KAI9587960.1 hypothetical protein GQX74_003806 [Glossina fuscipes]